MASTERPPSDWMRFQLLGRDPYDPNIITVGVLRTHDSGFWEFWRRMGIVDTKKINSIKQKNVPILEEAVGTMRVKGQSHPLFKRVLLLSLQNLGRLIETVEKLSKATSSNQLRQDLYETWLQLLRSYLGTGTSEGELRNLTMEQISEKVVGLPGTSAFLKDIRLRDIPDQRVFSDIRLAGYTQNITRSLRQLYEIFNENNPLQSFRSNEIKYFWIEEDLLP